MKKHLSNKKQNVKRGVTVVFTLALIGTTLLTINSCKKTKEVAQQSANAVAPNAQEQLLFGKWQLKRTEIYEVTGVDNNGQYTGPIIGGIDCNEVCKLELKSDYWWAPYKPEFKGIGSIGTCDSTSTFIWKAKQQKKLEVGAGKFYDIVYLTADSMALSYFHEQDILKLKDVYYYKRN